MFGDSFGKKAAAPALNKRDAIGGKRGVKKMMDTDSSMARSDSFGSDDMYGGRDQGQSDQDSEVSKFSMAQFDQFNKANQNIYQGMKFRDTISELYDDSDKDRVFKSSMKKGGAMHKFNKQNMFGQSFGQGLYPPQGQDEQPAPGGGGYAAAAAQKDGDKEFKFPKTQPTPEEAGQFRAQIPTNFRNLKGLKGGMIDEFKPAQNSTFNDQFADINQAFGLKPKFSQSCPKHREKQVEFYCEITSTFYCRICAQEHQGHNDVPIAEVSDEMQNSLNELKHIYLTKRTHIVDRLVNHQQKIESFFKIYYDCLDAQRMKMLGPEYELRKTMASLETRIMKLLDRCQKLDTVDFFVEQDTLKDQIAEIKYKLTKMSNYMPTFKLKNFDDVPEVTKQINKLIQEKQAIYLEKIDHYLAIDNFTHITNELDKTKISAIYNMLGPFDFFQTVPGQKTVKKPKDMDEDEDDKRYLDMTWQKRRSGAEFRGEINQDSKRPDGMGIKIYGGTSMYEGFFVDGCCHGLGRGITSKGEVYQGQFQQDQMEGHGFFAWPDGRIYEGEWIQGKKNGLGKYYWTNGQVYDGEFKMDNCNGKGNLYYPDGKVFIGLWRDGQKNGKGEYHFPNGAKYKVTYVNGKKTSQGALENAKMNIEELREDYQSLAKKATHGKEFLIKSGAYPGDTQFGASKVQKYFQGVDQKNEIFGKMQDKMQRTLRDGQKKQEKAMLDKMTDKNKRSKSKY